MCYLCWPVSGPLVSDRGSCAIRVGGAIHLCMLIISSSCLGSSWLASNSDSTSDRVGGLLDDFLLLLSYPWGISKDCHRCFTYNCLLPVVQYSKRDTTFITTNGPFHVGSNFLRCPKIVPGLRRITRSPTSNVLSRTVAGVL